MLTVRLRAAAPYRRAPQECAAALHRRACCATRPVAAKQALVCKELNYGVMREKEKELVRTRPVCDVAGASGRHLV